MEKVLEGDLSRFEVPELLTFLNMARRTGVLVLERRDQETKLFLRDGQAVYATSTSPDLRLGALLVRLGRLAADALDAILDGRDGRRMGQQLLADGLLTAPELASFLKVQVSEVVFDTFGWPDGSFTFWDRVPPPGTAVTLEMDLPNLLMEGVRRLDSRGRLAEAFPKLEAVVEALANPERVRLRATLTPEEWKILFLVDGRRTLADICRLVADAEEHQTQQILWNLLRAKFIRVAPPLPDRAEEPAAEDEKPKAAAPAGRQPAAVKPRVSVEFASLAPSPKLADDTRDIVTPMAIPYLARARTVTVSRLILLQDGRETSFPLSRDAYTLGRHRNNDILISDPKVSSFHARLERTPEGFVLVDLNSRNGSFLNGKRIETALLRTGDEVRLGTAKLLYRIDYEAS